MTLKNPQGTLREAAVDDDFAGGCFDEVVVLIGDDVFGPGDLGDWTLVAATERELHLLTRGGFSLLH